MPRPKPPPRATAPVRPRVRIADVRGAVRLAASGVAGVANIAEGLHGNILRIAPPLGNVAEQPLGGISGFVYRTVRTTSEAVGFALDRTLAGMQAVLPAPADATAAQDESPQRMAVVAALNGVMGDHLARTGNPLAIRMELLPRGAAGPHLLLLVHGLCMSDLQWERDGHDHGTALQAALGLSPVYVRYNSGLHVSQNGEELAALLEQMVAGWPVPVQDIAIIGHSMGGLVARSALHQALEAGMAWPRKVTRMVFLGTPQHGAALERGGNWLHTALGVSPYLAPFARLGAVRSDGITDLRHGNLLQQDWQDGRLLHRDTRKVVPLPPGIACYAIAGTLANAKMEQAFGDGLVSVDSALGRHERTTHGLRLPPSRTWVAQGVNHMDLLSDAGVYARLRRWLGAAQRRKPAPTES